MLVRKNKSKKFRVKNTGENNLTNIFPIKVIIFAMAKTVKLYAIMLKTKEEKQLEINEKKTQLEEPLPQSPHLS